RGLAGRLRAEGLLAPERREALKRFLDQRRAEYQLDVVEVFAHGQAIARSRRGELPTGIGLAPWSDLVRRVARGPAAAGLGTSGWSKGRAPSRRATSTSASRVRGTTRSARSSPRSTA